MKSYVFNLNTYDLAAAPVGYDYSTAAELWLEVDDLNEAFPRFTVTLTENASGSLVLAAEPTAPAIRRERRALAAEMERIADEYGGFELPERYLLGEREINELLAAL